MTEYLLGLDPGKTTGFAFAYLDSVRPLIIAEHGTIEDGLDGFIDWWESRQKYWSPADEKLVIERFIIDGTITGTWASQIEGAIKVLHPQNNVWQLRSDKATVFNQKEGGDKGQTERFAWLRERGFEGVSHELDAQTHLLVYAKRQKHLPTLRKYWGPSD